MGAYSSAIVGLGYAPGRAEAAALLKPGLTVDLVRDEANKHDENAVAVYFRSVQLGFIPARHAAWVSEIIDTERPILARVTRVEVSGWLRKRADAVSLELFTGNDALSPADRAERARQREEAANYRDAWSVMKNGLHVLRWLGEVGRTPHDKQRYVMDSYIHARAADRALTISTNLSERLRDGVMANSGARSTAMSAARALAKDIDDIEALAPCVTAMVKADDQFSPAEAEAVSDLLKTLRRARARADG